MLCKIADLIADVPKAGGLAPRCRDYLYSGKEGADVIIRTELYRPNQYGAQLSEEALAYMESAYQFYLELIKHDGLYLHASAIAFENRAYLFSAPSGTGKSTHTRLWQSTFGKDAQVFNDDKPAVRRLDGTWYAYGTPWCGKDGININMKVPLAGICFLKQSTENRIRRLTSQEAFQKIFPRTINKLITIETMDNVLVTLDRIVKEIPMYELENRPEPAAAQLSYETMRCGAEEMGL